MADPVDQSGGSVSHKVGDARSVETEIVFRAKEKDHVNEEVGQAKDVMVLTYMVRRMEFGLGGASK